MKQASPNHSLDQASSNGSIPPYVSTGTGEAHIGAIFLGFVPLIPGSEIAQMPRHRVLVVNHEQEAAGMLALMCDILGWQSTTATSMDKACAVAQTHNFDLVITDHYLPPDNGLVLIQRLRQLGLTMPAVVLTHEPKIAECIHSSFLKITRVLIEPWTLKALKAVLNESTQSCVRSDQN